MTKISDIKTVKIPKFSETNGSLFVLDNIKFNRFFAVKSAKNQKRGFHSHKVCSQLLFCSNGEVDVYCYDGFDEITFNLKDFNTAILIPPGIWSYQTYLKRNTILNVLCDFTFDENDYIRDFEEFKNSVI